MNRSKALIGLACAAMAPASYGSLLVIFNDGSGLSAEAEFELLGAGDEVQIRLKNTSYDIPLGFSNSDQLLTGISWDAGPLGFNGDANITAGTVVIGSTSTAYFDTGTYGPGYDVSGEWGYGNMDGTGALPNFVSANAAQGTPFGGPNLDGPSNVDGPQGGLVSSVDSVPLGGLGAIQDEVIIHIYLTQTLGSIEELFGDLGDARVEFGSDAHFIQTEIPAPGVLAPLALAGFATRRRR